MLKLILLLFILFVISKSQVYYQNTTPSNNNDNNNDYNIITNTNFLEKEYSIIPIILCLFYINRI